ncbi:hypothetical protein BE221DRAFT_15912 [Ostreococcus tauri]|uniref:tRNA-splicing endonuclease subunit Sen54 N-terminal domain-containing protein n=1 Tax=Ostreococcus tauri TaxID=70448 RepID=A0A1Y5I6K4_OSTTA|nr:hypothetical protein BE221DRAFT_15912 [Ostreococcus tauri]
MASVFKRGVKATHAPRGENASDAGERRREQRDVRLDAALRAWTTRRGSHESNVSVAIWRRERSMAEVIRSRGRQLQRVGTARGNATWLFAEECAFLCETERLALFFDEREEECASVRAVYALMERTGVGWEEYLAYAHLRRLGYGCRRFGSAWTVDARSSDDWAKETGGIGRWGGGENGDGVKTGEVEVEPIAEPPVKRRRVEETRKKQRDLPSRRWWLAAGDDAHDWIGPEIDAAARARTESHALEYDESPVEARLTFQVYQPNRHFSKKSPDPVSFYVYVCSDRPPTGREARALLDQAQGKPVRVVSCRQSTVMMFTIAGG